MTVQLLQGHELLRAKPNTYYSVHMPKLFDQNGICIARNLMNVSIMPNWLEALTSGDLYVVEDSEPIVEKEEVVATKFVDKQPHEEIELSEDKPEPKKLGRPAGSKNKTTKGE